MNFNIQFDDLFRSLNIENCIIDLFSPLSIFFFIDSKFEGLNIFI